MPAREELVAAPQAQLERRKCRESACCGELRISPRQIQGSINFVDELGTIKSFSAELHVNPQSFSRLTLSLTPLRAP